MELDLPTVSTTTGPQYASQINTAIEAIDAHDHSSGNGRRVTPSGLNINADLNINNQLMTDVKALAFKAQATLQTSTRRLHIDSSGDLYYNDGSGNQIKLTDSGAINVAGSGGFGGDYVSAGASAIYTDSSLSYTFRDSSSNNALGEFGGLETTGRRIVQVTTLTSNTTITGTGAHHYILSNHTSAVTYTLPSASTSNRFLVIKDISGDAAGNPITIARAGSDTIDGVSGNYTLQTDYGAVTLISDGTSAWHRV